MVLRFTGLAGSLALLVAMTAAPVPALAQVAAGDAPVAGVATGGTVSRIEVRGTQRIEPDTVVSYLKIAPGDSFSRDSLDESLKALFATGLFSNVDLSREGGVLVVTVAENPIVNRIAFEGNKHIEDSQLETEITSKPRVVYTRTRVQSDVDRILEIYRRSGRFAAKVEPKIIELEQNRVDLVFEIDEGPLTTVREISFVGNEQFSDDRLKEEIQTQEAAWYRFLSNSDTYDPDRVTFDRELLRRFYLKRGYADFRVVSAVAELTPDRQSFFLTFTVEEGERYKFGKVQIESSLRDLDTAKIEGELTTSEGDWYNSEEVENSVNKLTEAVGNLQYAFVDVRPRVRRNREEKTIDLTYEVKEGPRVFVERIDITGNVRTEDRVIRREMLLAEGDPFNASAMRRSERRIRDLGFFEKVNVNSQQGSSPDQTVVDVQVTEQSTGEISLGAGYSSTDGVLGDVSLRERNFLGKGQDLRFGTSLSQRTQEFDISFTEPYFLERDLSAGFDLFRTTRDNQDETSFDEKQTGFTLRMGYPLSPSLRQKLNYTLKQVEIDNVDDDASRYIKEQEGEIVTSAVGQDLTYDKRDSRIDPTDGYVLTLSNDLAGLGGDTNYLRNRLTGSVYFPVLEQVVLSVTGEGGYTWGFGKNSDEVNINDRFFIGGQTLRGFESAGIGPRDLTDGNNDALGGTKFYRASAELAFPIGLPEEMGIQGHTFADAGSLWGSEAKAKNGESFRDDNSLRVSAGVGVSWKSPVGPIRVDLAKALKKEDYDETEVFHFSFGTRF